MSWGVAAYRTIAWLNLTLVVQRQAKEEADVLRAEATAAAAKAVAVQQMVSAGFSETQQEEILQRGVVKITASMTARNRARPFPVEDFSTW